MENNAPREDNVIAVVLNWNRPHDTAKCVESLMGMSRPASKIIVVDNGSSDDSVNYLSRRFPATQIIESAENLGFGGGMNLGLKAALHDGADWIWLLNNDLEVASDCLHQLLQAVEDDREVAAVSPAIYEFLHRDRMASIGKGIVRWRLGSTTQLSDGDGRPGDYLSGAALLIRARAMQAVGMFDERFFMGWEDVDLGLRLQASGWTLATCADAKIWHAEAKSTENDTSLREAMYADATHTFFRKWRPRSRAPLIISGLLAVRRRVKCRDWQGAATAARAHAKNLIRGPQSHRPSDQKPSRNR